MISIPKQLVFRICDGSGFFYRSDNDNNFWIVTNKHILYPSPYPDPDEINWEYSKNIEKNCFIKFHDLHTNKDKVLHMKYLDAILNLDKRVKNHSNPNVDVSLLQVNDLYTNQKSVNLENSYLNELISNNYTYFSINNIPIKEPVVNLEICILGFPGINITNTPSKVDAKIISGYCDSRFNIPLLKIDQDILEGFSGSPVFSLSSFEKFKESNDYQDLSLVGVVTGRLKDSNQGVITSSKFVREVLHNGQIGNI